MALPMLLKIDDVVEQTGLSERKVKQLIATGEIESVRIDRCRRVPAEALAAYVARLRGQTTREEYLRQIVDSIPPLTQEQRDLVTGLLSPATPRTGTTDAA